MSGRLISLVMRGAHGLSLGAKSVLIVLAEHAATDDVLVFPGRRRIAAMLGIGERRAQEHVDELLRIGWVWQAPKSGRGPGNPAKYRIDFASMREPAAEFDRSKGARIVVVTPVYRADKGANVRPLKGADVRRLWTDEKVRKLTPKGADSAPKGAHVEPEKVRTGAAEPEVNRTSTGFEPARAPASTSNDQAPAIREIIKPVLENLTTEPEPPRTASGDLTSNELERRKQSQLEQLAAKIAATGRK